jgi:hypothetical protein
MFQTVEFTKPNDQYVRDTKPIRSAIEQQAFYLSRMKGITIDAARDFILTQMKPGGRLEFKDPKVTYMHRENYEDRVLKETSMTGYLKDVMENNESMSPTFTSYCSPDVKQSLLALNTMEKIKDRDRIKGEMFDAKNAGDKVTEMFKDLGQNNAKLRNNSLSGASLSASTCLFNPTSHSTLTTNCRNTTAYGNANNEKFIEGNRHYFDVEVILNNLVSISVISDMEKVERAMKMHELYYPSKEDVLECIDYSRELYFRSNRYMGPVYDFVEKMKPLERAAFVYTGDLYHLHKYNPELVTKFLLDMTKVPTEPLENPDVVMKGVDGDMINLARQICRSFSVGKKPKEIRAHSEHEYCLLAQSVNTINEALLSVIGIHDAFWMSDNMPASAGNFPFSLRRSVLGGDTDSTLFTVQEWVRRIYGRIGFTDEMECLSDAVIYLTAQTVQHLLAKMSANYGVHPDRVKDIQMKNEYKFKIFTTTSMAKHYFAMKTAQEGNVFRSPALELKGANLISAATPGDVVKSVKTMIMDFMIAVTEEKDIYLDDILDTISEKEKAIFNTVKSGQTDFFRTTDLKVAKAYKNQDPDKNPYWYHTFWNATFGKVYGKVDEPPYRAMKIAMEVRNQTDFNDWLEKLDAQLADDIRAELKRVGKKMFTTLYVPQLIVQLKGIPQEMLEASNARKIVKDSCSAYYHFIESLGLFMVNSKNTRMVYDTY